MASRPVIKVVGYKWLSSRPHSACKKCAGLHNQEFYYHPKGGQNSVADMPDPPLHPNCRCHIQDITRTSVELSEQEEDQSYVEGGFEALGGRWTNNGRGLSDGPVYEKWCGQYWSGGRDTRDPDAIGPRDITPSDELDRACRKHDNCYDMFEEDYCDRRLVRDLESLSDNPNGWRHPPGEKNAEKAEEFRKWAIRWFKWQIHRTQNKRRAFQEELPISP